MITRYAWRGGEELVFATGVGNRPKLLVLQPLFEEANRTRRLLAAVMRALAGAGLDGVLPDLPGMGDSLTPLSAVAVQDWRDALAAFALMLDAPFVTLAVRGGALLDDVPGAAGHLRLAPAEGASIMRNLFRTRLAADREDAAGVDMGALEALAADAPIELGGNRLGPTLIAGLRETTLPLVSPLRTLRLDSDPAAADAKLAAQPLWRRAEPGDDPDFTRLLASEAVHWVRACVG